ncbi:MAG: cytochrome c oxidase subunit II [Chloroflexota bacterium]
MATVPQQQNQSTSGLHLMPLIVFGGLSLVFGFVMWAVLPALNVLPEAASVEAERTDGLFRVLMGIGGVVFFLVQGLIYYAAVAFRAKEGDTSDGPNIHGNVMLEIVWTIVPSLIVVVLAIYSYFVWIQNNETPEAPNIMYTTASLANEDASNSIVINAIGQRYAWNFEYITNDFADVLNDDDSITPDAGNRVIINTADLFIYAGQEVDLDMNTRDVIHSFWAPEMRVKQDLLPGRTTNVIFTPREPANSEGWEYVWVNAPVTIYTEQDFASDPLVDITLEDEPAGTPVEFALVDLEENFTSTDDVNWIRVYDERGREGFLPITAEDDWGRANRYRLICTELCGGGHGDMFTDIVMFENQGQFLTVWYEPTVDILSVPVGDPFELGEQVIESYGCAGCHVLGDLGWIGVVGPTMDGIGSRSGELAEESAEAIGNVVDPNAEYLAQSIRLSQDYKVPGYNDQNMPYFRSDEMSQEHLNGIVAYLCAQTVTGDPNDSDCGLQNWEFDENGNFVGDVDALVAELTAFTDDYED